MPAGRPEIKPCSICGGKPKIKRLVARPRTPLGPHPTKKQILEIKNWPWLVHATYNSTTEYRAIYLTCCGVGGKVVWIKEKKKDPHPSVVQSYIIPAMKNLIERYNGRQTNGL